MDNLKHTTKKSSREYMRDYMKDNIHKYTKKTECFCGGKYDSIHKARHLKSKRHCKMVNESTLNATILIS
jgi:hypothetical protein